MADVTEVIHKISYEVNDDALINATKAIQAQIVELNSLQKTLDRYTQQLHSFSDAEGEKLDLLIRKIDVVNKKLLSNASATKSSITDVFKGVLKGLDIPDTLKDSVAEYVRGVKMNFGELSKASRNASVGFAAHMKGTARIGKSSLKPFIKTVAKVGKGLLSFTGFAGLAANVLLTFGENLFTSGERAKVFSKEVQQAAEFAKKLGSEAGNEISNLVQLRSKIEDLNLAYSDRLFAVQQIRSMYPDYFTNLTNEEILAGKVAKAYSKITQSIVASAKARVFDGQLDEIIKKVVATEQKINDQVKQKGLNRVVVGEDQRSGLATYNIRSKSDAENISDATLISRGFESGTSISNKNIDYDPVRKLINEYNDQQKQVNEILDDIDANNVFINSLKPKVKSPLKPKSNDSSKPISEVSNETIPKVDIRLEPIFDESELDSSIHDIAKVSVIKLQDQLKYQQQQLKAEEQKKLIDIENGYKLGLLTFEKYEQEKVDITNTYAIKRYDNEIQTYKQIATLNGINDGAKASALNNVSVATLSKVRLQNQNKQMQSDRNLPLDKDSVNDKELEHIQTVVKAYQSLSAAAVDAYNKITKAQEEALDKEIAIREKRVEEAKKLAERGNSEALRIEQERLEDAQKKKEEIGRREQAVNSALALSNSLVAVTSAIATATKSGDPYTVAARVAAAIAAVLGALVAGQSFVKSFDTSTGAFADGVVDYKGKGGPRDDQNLVRISNGESVITAEGTQRNRALLEAINRGENFSLMGNGLPFVMPQFISPTGSTRYVSATNMRNVERKLDGVVAAIEDNRLKQNIFFNEHGVGLMTERAIKKNNRRFK